MKPATIALVGDYSASVVAHRAIPRALDLVASAGPDIAWHWVATRDIRDASRDLARYAGVWVVPASPYENMTGALDAIRWARETRRPLLGTCGGFQHALIEFARNVAGLKGADHAETNPDASTLVVAPLSCAMVEKTGPLCFEPGSLIQRAYAADSATEGYHCHYGLNPAHRADFERHGLRFTAFDGNDEIRAAELPQAAHPFFVGTLFQPERAALRGVVPPLVSAFVTAVWTAAR
jgi:CTP synthase (UTP-ammonia lyase)